MDRGSGGEDGGVHGEVVGGGRLKEEGWWGFGEWGFVRKGERRRRYGDAKIMISLVGRKGI